MLYFMESLLMVVQSVHRCRQAQFYGRQPKVRSNLSFNRKQWGMPSFGAPFHSAPNAVIPHCSG
jgi:hypothetical protein